MKLNNPTPKSPNNLEFKKIEFPWSFEVNGVLRFEIIRVLRMLVIRLLGFWVLGFEVIKLLGYKLIIQV